MIILTLDLIRHTYTCTIIGSCVSIKPQPLVQTVADFRDFRLSSLRWKKQMECFFHALAIFALCIAASECLQGMYIYSYTRSYIYVQPT